VARRPIGPDHVALVLALGLTLLASLILVGTIVQILHGNPEVVLSENATQILIAATSGLTGVLGGYMGYRLHQGEDEDDDGPPS
jgi:hypothetical protein